MSQVWIRLPNRRFVCSGICMISGKPYETAEVTKFEIDQYEIEGKHAQVAFPNLSAEDREFIISGISPDAWNELFPKGLEDGPQLSVDEAAL